MGFHGVAVRAMKSVIRRRLLRGRFRSEAFEFGARASGRPTPVLMCLWNRPTRLADVLRMLDAQVGVPEGIELHLWNNNKLDHEHYRAVLRDAQTRGALVGARITRTPYNLGSIARFLLAREIAKAQGAVPVIVIDDDEDFEPGFVATALAEYRPGSIHAWWAFQVGDSYFERTHAEPGQRVDHIGPGGSVMDASMFLDDSFFNDIPARYRLLDDIWLTWWATNRGRTLAKLPVEMTMVMDETNQYHQQTGLKQEFFDALYPHKTAARKA